jgi:hypothetical protein
MACKPFLTFLYLDEFADDWSDLNLSFETDAWDLEVQIMSLPKAGDVVKGACGLRKLRFAPASWNVGKSGGVRIGYAYFEELAIVVMIQAYDHNEKDNFSAEEKKAICKALGQIEQRLRKKIGEK